MANITIIEDNAGSYYSVRDAGPGLEHCYIGVPCTARKLKIGSVSSVTYAPKKGARERLVRRLLTRVVLEG